MARSIGRHMDAPRVVGTKSTVPVGTAGKVSDAIRAEQWARGVEITFEVVSNPEFLKEGSAVADFQKPDRIVVIEVHSAELTKVAANALLAKCLGADIERVRIGIGSDPRNCFQLIWPGCCCRPWKR